MNARYNRRRFLSTLGRGCAGVMILGNSRSAWSYQENEKLGIAVIGAGGRGAENLGAVELPPLTPSIRRPPSTPTIVNCWRNSINRSTRSW
jgi:hypothetical protein